MRWYCPSFSGDFRLEADGAGSILIVKSPTLGEQKMLDVFLYQVKKLLPAGFIIPAVWPATTTIKLLASVAKVGPKLVRASKPKDRTLTVVRFKNGQLETADAATDALEQLAEKAEASLATSKPAEAAVSVKRPTPCCPQCVVGATPMASEVLLDFLTPEQHETWRRQRYIDVWGGESGVHYIIAHRNSKLAAKFGRICFDDDYKMVVHFHDRMVPAEEEVLAAKLILEHREPWLRNEATMLGWPGPGAVSEVVPRYKNPFGGFLDGVPDALFTQQVGTWFMSALRGLKS